MNADQPTAPPAKDSPARSTPDAPEAVTVHVGELVLHGFPSADRHRIGEAFQQELTRLMSEAEALSVFQGGAEIERLSGGSFQFHADARPETTGVEIARAVFGGLKR